MKLLYIANIRIPTEKAHGYQIMKMCESFADLGIDVELIIPRRKNPEFSGVDPFKHFKTKKNFHITKLFQPDPRFLLAFPAGTYAKVQTAFFLFSLWRVFKKNNHKGTILYTRDSILIPLLLRFSKNVVWEAHSIPTHKFRYKKFWKQCKHIFTLTSSIQNQLRDLNIDSSKIHISPDCVDIERFDRVHDNKAELREQLGLPKNKNIIGFVGKFLTLGQDKGIKDLLEAIKSVDAYLCCVGGSQKEIKQYENLAQEFGLSDDVYTLIPHVNQEKVAQYCKACDILAMPFPNIPHYAYFMSPLKMFEYMASKRPIITSDLPSVRDVLNEKNCLFVNSDDPKDLAEKIEKLLGDKDLSESLSSQAYSDVQQYTWKNRAEKIKNFL